MTIPSKYANPANSKLTADPNSKATSDQSRLNILLSFATELITVPDETELAWYVVREVVGKLGFVDCVIYLLDPEHNSLKQVAALGSKNPRDNEITHPLKIPVGKGITGHVAEKQQAIIIGDLSLYNNYIPDIEAAQSEICVPLIFENSLFGVIDCEDGRLDHFDRSHLQILESVAALTSAKLALIKNSRELQNIEQHNKLIFETALDGIITIDAEGIVVECNKAAEEMFRLDSGEIVGNSMADKIIPPSYQAKHHSGMQRYLETGNHNILDQRIEITGMRNDGEEFPIELTVTPHIVDGRQLFTGFLRDVKKQKDAERERRVALTGAVQANRAKSQFLAMMSHELRTPLNAISGFSEMLESEIFGPLGSPKYREYVSYIHESSAHLLTLVNDILDLSAIEAGKVSLVKEELSVNEVITNCRQFISANLVEKRIILYQEVAEDLPLVYADRRALVQILLNVLSNATKYTPEEGKITLRVTVSPSHHVFEIIDTGQGVPEENIASLTDPFIRVETNSHKTHEGSGLGLAIVRSLIDLHNGSINIASKFGEGMTVIITLPRKTLDQ